MLQSPELDGVTERFLNDWQPLPAGALDGAADILARLGDNAALMRQSGTAGDQIVTAAGSRAGVSWMGQGSTVGEALRNLRAIA